MQVKKNAENDEKERENLQTLQAEYQKLTKTPNPRHT